MTWVKRNLFFLIGGGLAVLLLGGAGWYLFTRWQLDRSTADELTKAYADLEKFAHQQPNPGNANIDNIKLAVDYQSNVVVKTEAVRAHFAPIASIPPAPSGTNAAAIDDAAFKSALNRTIERLNHDAEESSVALPPRYNFSFEAQRPLFKFVPGSLQPLANQLGEIATICQVLFQARINSLDNLQRERVSDDDQHGPQSDYLDDKSATNDLAVLTPYDVSIHCFSTDLAGVLAGFANSPSGIIVKTINVEPAAAAAAATDSSTAAAAAPVPVSTKGGLPVVLEEKQLKVTMQLVVVKLLPPK